MKAAAKKAKRHPNFRVLTSTKQPELNRKEIPKQNVCETCFKVYKAKKYLDAHQQSKHGDFMLTFYCPTCSKEFSTKYLLKYHCINDHGQTLTEEEFGKCTGKKKNSKQGKK